MYLINVGFCIVYNLNKWIQLQYGGKHCFILRTFRVNKLAYMSKDMSLEGANYVQDFPELFIEKSNNTV
jgi:hypothetical protein